MKKQMLMPRVMEGTTADLEKNGCGLLNDKTGTDLRLDVSVLL